MSDQSPTTNNNQQMIVIALVVVAALLAAIVGVIVWQQSQSAKIPSPTALAPSAPAATTPGTASGSSGAPAGMGQGTAAAPGPFDAKTATKVPSSMTPEQLVKAYNENVIAGKFAEAYALLPLDKQQSYGDAKAYEAQVKAYGITSYNMGKPTTSGDTVEVVAEQVTPQMPITYTWTFKKVGGQWFVASRTMGGTVTK
jgi:hypothetical protein